MLNSFLSHFQLDFSTSNFMIVIANNDEFYEW